MELFYPKVSIIMPVYNGSNYLREAIDSAIAQTYGNLEIIVVNDGSNDQGATESIAMSYGNRIRYFSKPNGGVATALNLGIEKMTGDYFSWLSHDDVYLPHKIAIQIKILHEMKQDKVILYSDYSLIDAQGEMIAEGKLDTAMLHKKPLYSLLRGSVHGCSLLIPKQAFQQFGLFDEQLRTTQDYDLWFKMRTEFQFVHIPQVLIQSRVHGEQDSKKNPATFVEANQLWIRFYHELSTEEMLSCESSVYLFLKYMSEFLAATPYTEAYEFYRSAQVEEYRHHKAAIDKVLDPKSINQGWFELIKSKVKQYPRFAKVIKPVYDMTRRLK